MHNCCLSHDPIVSAVPSCGSWAWDVAEVVWSSKFNICRNCRPDPHIHSSSPCLLGRFHKDRIWQTSRIRYAGSCGPKDIAICCRAVADKPCRSIIRKACRQMCSGIDHNMNNWSYVVEIWANVRYCTCTLLDRRTLYVARTTPKVFHTSSHVSSTPSRWKDAMNCSHVGNRTFFILFLRGDSQLSGLTRRSNIVDNADFDCRLGKWAFGMDPDIAKVSSHIQNRNCIACPHVPLRRCVTWPSCLIFYIIKELISNNRKESPKLIK